MNAKLSALVNRLRQDEQGLSTVEYVVLLVLIVAMAVAAWNSFGNSVNSKLGDASAEFGTQVTQTPGAASTTPGGAGN